MTDKELYNPDEFVFENAPMIKINEEWDEI